MDEKTLHTLEFFKVLEQLANYAAFSLSAELARALRPTSSLLEAQQRQARTTQARYLLSILADFSVGGARDVRALVDLARRGGVLEGSELLDIKNTLVAARSMARSFERHAVACPDLAVIAAALPPPAGVIDSITQAISERGEVMDHASVKLASIRRELKIQHERLLARLERMINDPHNGPMLQESLITQRDGRYVIPLRAEFKGKIRGITHDQSASGATLFIEPLATVELNNRWHELQLAERDEIRRILAEISSQIGRQAEQVAWVLQALAEMDLALMCAKYADDQHAAEPLLVAVRTPTEKHPGTTMRLFKARHPLLKHETVVPIDVDLDENTYALVITGPNTGGKTVTLKTVGLLALMSQAGLHIPAQSGSSLSLFDDIFADIGDEQSIEQSLSTFSGHITNIIRILNHAAPSTLVLLDELGAGTDPQEGAALARSLLAHLVERRIPCLVATHYPELKAFAHNTPGAINASMEFDLRTLRPTYHLTIGLPGRSNALLIAERIGLPQEILKAARQTVRPEARKTDNLLDEIRRQRDSTQRLRSQAERALHDAEILRAEVNEARELIEDERMAVLEEARAQAEQELRTVREELDDLRRALSRARQPLEALKPVQQQVENLAESVQSPVERKAAVENANQPYRVGEKVRVRSLQMDGILTAVGENDLEVQLGALRVRVRANELQRPGEKDEPPKPTARPKRAPRARKTEENSTTPITLLHPSPGMELDLRGQRAEDALDMLERYLESAYLSGMPFVRIIHGKGTGRLRQVVREALGKSSHVKHFENGQEGEGGDGVTVAHIQPD